MAAPVSAATLDPKPAVRRFTIGGRQYVYREISVAEYDRLMEECRRVENGVDVLDQAMFNRRLFIATCESPGHSLAQVARMGFGRWNSLMAQINKLYYEIEQPKTVEENEADDDEKGEG